MSFEELEQATPAHKEERQARLPEVSISAADIRTDQLRACPTEDIEGTVVAVGESMNGKRVEVAGADATPDSTPDLTTQASQLKFTDGQRQPNGDGSDVSNQGEVVPSGTVMPGGAVKQNRQGPDHNKATSMNPHVETHASHNAITLPADLQHAPSERTDSAPPTPKTRSTLSATQQGDSNPPRLDHVENSSSSRWDGRPQTDAKADDTINPVEDGSDGNETSKPYRTYANLLTSDPQSILTSRLPSINLDQPAPENPPDLTSHKWSEFSQVPIYNDEFPPLDQAVIDQAFGKNDSSFDVHQQMEDRRATPPLPIGPANLMTLPEVSSTSDDDKLDGTALGAAFDAARTQLFVTLTRRHDAEAPKTATLNIATAQRLLLAEFTRRLTESCHEILTVDKKESAIDTLATLRKLLDGYCNSLRNLEYMQEHAARHAKNDELDPFYLKSSKHLQKLAMEEEGLIPDHVLPKGVLPIARDQDAPRLPGLSRTVAHRASECEQLWVRFGMASAGGLVLVVPMLIMANLESKTASLVTTCVAMFLFAAGITFGTHLKPDQVLGATAAYAAVLVVFVGTSFST